MEWISSAETLDRLGGSYEARLQWAEVIVASAGEGIINARAKAIVLNGQRMAGNLPEVPKDLWLNAFLEQNWITGYFKASSHPLANESFHCKAFGVQFAADDIADLNPCSSSDYLRQLSA